MRINRIQKFVIPFLAFLALGVPFKVMVLVEGFTEVRPVNAIPPVVGLVCGPIGAFACGLANLVADLFGSFSLASLLGVAANFLAAYLPYRFWHMFREEEPNLHKMENILFYIGISLEAALYVAWILGFGLLAFFHSWVPEIYTYIFFNNFGFSILLGMPLLIILTSDSIQVVCQPKPKKFRVLRGKKNRYLVCGLSMVLLLSLFASVILLHQNPAEQPWTWAVSALLVGCLACQVV